MTYVLILLLWSSEPRNAVATAEFSSKATCEAAVAATKSEFNGYGTRTYAVCSPK